MSSRSCTGSPPSKRIKLESLFSTPSGQLAHAHTSNTPTGANSVDLNDDHCSICLQHVVDRTVIPTCAHEFCFECLLVWSEQSRRCPLCSQSVGEYLIHHIRSKYDYQKHYLTPLRTSPAPRQPLAGAQQIRNRHRANRRTAREGGLGRRERQEREEADQLARAIARRRWIYEHDLYAKHVASNAYTRYRPYPSPAQFSASSELISRTTTFLRRELRVWVNLDVEFLTTFIISLMKAIDIRSESAVKLLAEFLDMDGPYVEGGRHVNAEHFSHEVYCYVRSPFKDLFVYDTVVQYESPSEIPPPPPPKQQRSRRWQASSYSRSRSPPPRLHSPEPHDRHLQRSQSRSLSWSPSGRRYPSSKEKSLDELSAAESWRRCSHSGSRDRDQRASRCHYKSSHEPRCDEDRTVGDDSARDNDRQSEYDLDIVDPARAYKVQPAERGGMIDVKGKRRAGGVGDSMEVASPSIAEIENEKPTGSELRTRTHREEKPPADSNSAPRNPTSLGRRRLPRTLLESVQAHLAPVTTTNKKGKEKDTQTDSPHAAPLSSLPEHSGAFPSLLARLSDPNRTPDGDRLSFTQPTSSTPSLEISLSNKDHLSKTQISMSAPEIMARTRARMAKTKDQPFPETLLSTQPTTSSTLPKCHRDGSKMSFEVMAHSRELNNQAVAQLDLSGGDSNRLSNTQWSSSARDIMAHACSSYPDEHESERLADVVPSASVSDITPSRQPYPSPSDLRLRLLNRLEQEKKEISKAPLPDLDLTSAATTISVFHRSTSALAADNESSMPTISSPVPSDDPVDSQAMEAKLRTRALLRVRLAAAKRVDGGVHQESVNLLEKRPGNL